MDVELALRALSLDALHNLQLVLRGPWTQEAATNSAEGPRMELARPKFQHAPPNKDHDFEVEKAMQNNNPDDLFKPTYHEMGSLPCETDLHHGRNLSQTKNPF